MIMLEPASDLILVVYGIIDQSLTFQVTVFVDT